MENRGREDVELKRSSVIYMIPSNLWEMSQDDLCHRETGYVHTYWRKDEAAPSYHMLGLVRDFWGSEVTVLLHI